MHAPRSKIKTKTTSVNPIYWSILFFTDVVCVISYIFTIILFLYTSSFFFIITIDYLSYV
jgi:hypothetical protein